MTGLGRRRAAHRAPPTDDLRMDVADSRRARGRGPSKRASLPLMVVGTAGTTGGRSDRPAADSWRNSAGPRQLWFHVDAAGAEPRFSRRVWRSTSPASSRPTRSPATRTNGSQCRWAQACSSAVTVDAVRKRSAQRRPTCRRRLDGRASIRTRRRFSGRGDSSGSSCSWRWPSAASRGYAAMIEHQARMGDLLSAAADAQSGWRIVNDTPAAARLLHHGTVSNAVEISGHALRAADRLDVRGPASRRQLRSCARASRASGHRRPTSSRSFGR